MIGYDWLVQDFAIHHSKNSQIRVINPFWKTGGAWAKKAPTWTMVRQSLQGITFRCRTNQQKFGASKSFQLPKLSKAYGSKSHSRVFFCWAVEQISLDISASCWCGFLKATSNSLPWCFGCPQQDHTHAPRGFLCPQCEGIPPKSNLAAHNTTQPPAESFGIQKERPWGKMVINKIHL